MFSLSPLSRSSTDSRLPQADIPSFQKKVRLIFTSHRFLILGARDQPSLLPHRSPSGTAPPSSPVPFPSPPPKTRPPAASSPLWTRSRTSFPAPGSEDTEARWASLRLIWRRGGWGRRLGWSLGEGSLRRRRKRKGTPLFLFRRFQVLLFAVSKAKERRKCRVECLGAFVLSRVPYSRWIRSKEKEKTETTLRRKSFYIRRKAGREAG